MSTPVQNQTARRYSQPRDSAHPSVFLDGHFIAAARARISVFDRSFLYGDGVFETIRIRSGSLAFWPLHMDRFQRSAQALGLAIPLTLAALAQAALLLTQRNLVYQGVLRIHLSRGVGPRGYSPAQALNPTLLIAAEPLPPRHRHSHGGIRLATATLPLADPLNTLKTASRVRHVLAAAEAANARAHEALLLTPANHVAETTSANIFWIRGFTLFTPPLSFGILPGITRAMIFELASSLGLKVQERCSPVSALLNADGVFLTSSITGPRPASSINGLPLRQSPQFERIRAAHLRWQRQSAADFLRTTAIPA